MPFSATATCTEDQWTEIFDHLIKPAVEKAGLGYECRRSEATRGNIIKAIVQSLHEANVVIADLTDQNPNVFYELGVRHALSDRTILLSQKMDAIPFDLRPYATQVYNWKTEKGRKGLKSKLRKLLSEIDSEPERSDNPVSDFLVRRNRARAAIDSQDSQSTRDHELELPRESGEELNAAQLAASIKKRENLSDIRLYVGQRRRLFQMEWSRRILRLSSTQPESRTLSKNEAYDYAFPLVSQFDKEMDELEYLGLLTVESEWKEALPVFFELPRDWITLSEKRLSSYRAIQDAPALCAFRFMSVLAARAINNMAFELVGLFLREPLETRDSGGQLDMRSLVERRRLFYPEALLGRGDLAVRYLTELWDRSEYLALFFVSKQEYRDSLAKYYFLSCLGSLVAAPQHSPLFPGYAMIPGHEAALSSLVLRMESKPAFVSAIAESLGETPDTFRNAWPERAAALNAHTQRVDWSSDFSLPEKL
jgi:hypothetical protein